MGKFEYRVSGMTCHACDELITDEVSTLPGVTRVQARHQTGALIIESKHPLKREDVAAKVEAAGSQYSLL
jgi:copper chaperone CopZ